MTLTHCPTVEFQPIIHELSQACDFITEPLKTKDQSKICFKKDNEGFYFSVLSQKVLCIMF